MSRYINTIFCDDIRQEMGNKQSLMGVYQSDLLVPNIPATLLKLCIVITISTPIDQPFKKLVIKVTKDDELLMEAPLIGDQLHEPQQNIIENGDSKYPERRIAIMGAFVLSPFQIEKECILRVRADTENGELKGHGLRILKISQPVATEAQ
jgi:hypothetical protein